MINLVDPAGLEGRNPAIKKHRRITGKITMKGPDWVFFSRWTRKTDWLSEKYIPSCNIWMHRYSKSQDDVSKSLEKQF